jgi:hypothetical protein
LITPSLRELGTIATEFLKLAEFPGLPLTGDPVPFPSWEFFLEAAFEAIIEFLTLLALLLS